MAQATNEAPGRDISGNPTDKTVESQLPLTEENVDKSDKDRAEGFKEAELNQAKEVHGDDLKSIRDLPLSREGVLAGSLKSASKGAMDDAIYNVIRVLDAAGDAADKNADLRKVKEALAKGLGADIEFLI